MIVLQTKNDDTAERVYHNLQGNKFIGVSRENIDGVKDIAFIAVRHDIWNAIVERFLDMGLQEAVFLSDKRPFDQAIEK